MRKIPMVVDKDSRVGRVYDIYSSLSKDRILFVGTAMNIEAPNLLIV